MEGFWTANLLLRALPDHILSELRDHFEPTKLSVGQVIYRVGDAVTQFHFIDRGLVSLQIVMSDGRSVEVGAVGIEGFPGSTSYFGHGSAATDVIVQISGEAYSIRGEDLRDLIMRHNELREVVQRYSRFKIVQIAQTAACNRLHNLNERCVCKILTAHDNARTDAFQITHDYLSHVLGTQRAAVTTTLSKLRDEGLVDYMRGSLEIIDRAGLEQRSCECYATIRREIDVLFSGVRQT